MKLLKISKDKKSAYRCGFTLIEVLVVLGIFVIVSASLPVFDFGSVIRGGVADEALLFYQVLNKARNLSMQNIDDSDRGVFIGEDYFTIFSGSFYDERSMLNENFPRNSGVEINSVIGDVGESIIFEKYTGNIESLAEKSQEGHGSKVFLLKNGTASSSIKINYVGGIDW